MLVGTRRRGRDVSLEVWDTGIGIPADQQARVFEEFYQLANPERNSKKGLGLGLSISQSLIEAHGGRLGARQGTGPGAAFFFELPLAAADARR